jgi:hypothetical protein
MSAVVVFVARLIGCRAEKTRKEAGRIDYSKIMTWQDSLLNGHK